MDIETIVQKRDGVQTLRLFVGTQFERRNFEITIELQNPKLKTFLHFRDY